MDFFSASCYNNVKYCFMTAKEKETHERNDMQNSNEAIQGIILPVIPVPGYVAYPFVPINYDITRDGLIKAFKEADGADKTVLLAFCSDQDVYNPETSDLYHIGVIARIETSFSAGESDIKAGFRGICRGDIVALKEDDGVIHAEVIPEEYPAENFLSPVKQEALRRHMINGLEALIKLLPPENKEILSTARSIHNLSQLADYIAYSTLGNYEDKLKVLSEFDQVKRSYLVCKMLETDREIYKEELVIHKKISHSLEKAQYENYLREKMKVIKEELGEDTDDIDEYLDKINAMKFSLDAEADEKIREKMTKEVGKLSKMPFGSPESTVIKGYLDTCLELPWTKVTEDCTDIENARTILDRDHDGLEKPKERILEFLAVKKLNPDLKSQILCFAGPPGVGKTSLGRSIANAMGRTFARVSLGGIHDEAEIRGHRKTYIGSMPGRIIAAVQSAGTRNPVILLDEIDKMASSVQGDPASAMLEVLDPEQNKNFRDHFLEVPFDLSDCLFIATANNIYDVPPALADRMEIIELNTYTDEEKLKIAKNHLILKQRERHGLKKSNIRIKDEAVSAIIAGYTKESGVRTLEREIAKLCRKVAMQIASGEIGSVTVSPKNLEKYLGPAHDFSEKAGDDDLCGVVNGLAYTSVGGDVLKVETSVMPGDGKIKLTGTLGDVMKESAYLAVSYIRAHAEDLSVDKDFYKNCDIHIHVPEGATPKDGPSAGVTMLTSLASALCKKNVRHDVAMTGEITLTGRVLPIGGLKEKTFAAYKAGIKTVIIPKDNLPDLEEIDSTIREKLEFKPVSKADDVLNIAIIGR